ncbi:spore germination protein [Desulfolucanica intricata]|uniref:spore germination protein n=1 Tax=Desulfolucanica intricata TaxID=1285191 RepID=UPI000833D65E|nr:spore germination protein [Desulfolucanica intricata]
MNLKDLVTKIFGYNGPPSYETFSLKETEQEEELASDGEDSGNAVTGKQSERKVKKPKKAGEFKKTTKDQITEWVIQADLKINKERIETLFHIPLNKDVVIREFKLASTPPLNAFLVFMEGMSDKNVINNSILKPLMLMSNLEPVNGIKLDTCKKVLQNYLPSNQVEILIEYKDVVTSVTAGATVIFFEGASCCIAAETKGYQHRSVEAARTEQVVQGPQEGFVENLRSNTALIRRIIHSEHLITEFQQLGKRNNSNVAIMYLKNLANPKLIKEVKRRISGIKADYVPETGILEEFIEDHPFSLIPQTIKTERPDRVASMLVEGKVAIIVDNTPFVMVVPGTLFDFLHSPEDHYVRFVYGFWLRLIRVAAVFLTMLLPAFYVAIATFHQEMIPTDLLLSITASKERVPFPTIVELLLMELAFELVREAGVRVPGVIGPTLGIVGTLILGQAAVSASIVSPILIIVVAVTGLSSYAIPNYAASFGFRFMRFIFIFLAAGLGFFGISTGLFLLLCLLLSMKSFGVPYLAPIAPRTVPGTDLLARAPAWNQDIRPDYLQPLDVRRQPRLSRIWTKNKWPADQAEEGGENDARKDQARTE